MPKSRYFMTAKIMSGRAKHNMIIKLKGSIKAGGIFSKTAEFVWSKKDILVKIKDSVKTSFSTKK